MAKIRDRIPKETSGGYARLFGNEALGELMSKVQGAVISTRSELERLRTEKVETIDDLDALWTRLQAAAQPWMQRIPSTGLG